MKEKFDVTGMMCAACQSHVDKAVRKLDGVKDVNVNLLLNNMIVEYDNKKINNDQIIKAVQNAGYDAKLIEEQSSNDTVKGKNVVDTKLINYSDKIQSMKKRLIISIIFWIPLMYVAMHHMFYEWFGIPVPSFVKQFFYGTANALNFGFTQFLLLIPIVYVNRNYFISGFKKLLKMNPNMDSLIAIGSSAAIIYGVYAIYQIGYGLGHANFELVERFSKDLYFESSGTILTLVTVRKIFGN